MKQRCEICNIDLDENNFQLHMQGKKHRKNAFENEKKNETLERSIYVTRLPPGTTQNNIIDFFKQYGVIDTCRLEEHFAIISFRKKETVTDLLNKPIWMGSYKLEIKRRKWHNSSKSKQNKTVCITENFAELKTQLQSLTTLESEITTFLELVKWNRTEADITWQTLRLSLLEILKPIFPKCNVCIFGSSIAGLAFKGSDIDIFLDIGEPIYDDHSNGIGWTQKDIFKEVKFLLYRNKHIFGDVVPIPKAKTPIIKFYHGPSKICCDLSFKNILGVINSNLIKHLLNLDSRLEPLMMIVKYWAKMFDLSGTGKFTSYAIIMMLIFYLQQPEINLLPAIRIYQNTLEPIYMKNWQINFNYEVEHISSNKSTITELLAGFFQFYEKFSYNEWCIVPLTGRAWPRKDFTGSSGRKLGDTNSTELDCPICVVDPIELDNNVTSCVTVKLLEFFQSYCTVSAQVCNDASKNPNQPVLLDLFTTLPIIEESHGSQEIRISPRKTTLEKLLLDLETKDATANAMQTALNEWYALSQKLVEEIFKRVFKMNVQIIRTARVSKQQKVSETSDVHSKDNDKIVLDCVSSYCVIMGRKLKSSCIDPSLGVIDKESMISDDLVKEQQEKGIKPSKVHFTCTIIKEEKTTSLLLHLNNCKSEKKRFRPLASYLLTKLPILVDKELLHMIQYNQHKKL